MEGGGGGREDVVQAPGRAIRALLAEGFLEGAPFAAMVPLTFSSCNFHLLPDFSVCQLISRQPAISRPVPEPARGAGGGEGTQLGKYRWVNRAAAGILRGCVRLPRACSTSRCGRSGQRESPVTSAS